jgi:hypothetical protein
VSDQFALVPGNPLRGGCSRDFVLVHGLTPPLLTEDDHAPSARMSAFAVAIGGLADIAAT